MKNVRDQVIHSDIADVKKHGVVFLLLLLGVVLILSACSGGAADATDAPDATDNGATTEATENGGSDEDEVFTLEELADYDGQDGRPAYIAVDGVVYDVTDIPQWAGGSHAGGRFMAGKDYSEEIRSVSPHGTSMLSRATKVGVLAEE